jgi:hypothetical protein
MCVGRELIHPYKTASTNGPASVYPWPLWIGSSNVLLHYDDKIILDIMLALMRVTGMAAAGQHKRHDAQSVLFSPDLNLAECKECNRMISAESYAQAITEMTL